MKIKKYTARSMPLALQQVREDLGPDAIILDSRKINGSARGRSRGPSSVEVTAALDQTATAPRLQPAPAVAGKPAAPPALPTSIHTHALFANAAGHLSGSGSEAVAVAGNRLDRALDEVPGSVLESALQSARKVAHEFSPALAASATTVAGSATRVAGSATTVATQNRASVQEPPTVTPAGDRAGVGTLAHEVQRLQEAIARIERQAASQFVLPGEVSRVADCLRAAGIAEPLVCQCMHMVYAELDGAALEDRERVVAFAAEKLSEVLPGCRDIRVASKRRQVVGFVGLSGAGKTTAAAKIAAGFAARKTRAIGGDPRRILMITTDRRRLDAVDQIGRLARITGISHEIAHTEKEVAAALQRHPEARLVLIDTAGCGPHEREERAHQKRLLEAAGTDEVQVVIDGLTAYEHMLDVIESTRELSLKRSLLFTKMDEAVRRGAALSAAAQSGIPVSYLSVGPGFPGDLRPGDLGQLVREILEAPTADGGNAS